MIPPEDKTMELENCQESRTKQNEEEKKTLLFLLQGELISFPLRSCLSRWSHFLQLGGSLSSWADEQRWWLNQTKTTTTTIGGGGVGRMGCQVLSCFRSSSLPKGKRKTQLRRMQILACCKQRLAVMTAAREHQDTSRDLPHISSIFLLRKMVRNV